MKKRILLIFLAVAMVIGFVPIADVTIAQESVEIIVGHKGGTVYRDDVRATIEAAGVVRNGDIPFTVKFADGVTSIGVSAFQNCRALESIIIPDSVTSIADYAFYSCNSLKSVVIPNSVTSIGRSAFSRCVSLESVEIPDSVASIGEEAFLGCTSLTSINVNIESANFSSDERGVLFNKTKTLLIQYPIGNTATSYSIPNSVTSIGRSAFWDCKWLKSVEIPDSVTSIGNWSFRYCTSLTSITIPDSVTSIGGGAFSGCTGLITVTISNSNSIEYIGGDAFRDCIKLTEITIPNIQAIHSYTFEVCVKLTSVTIPESVQWIDEYAFRSCVGLTTLSFRGANPPYFDYKSLDNLTNLSKVYVPIGAKEAYSATPHIGAYRHIMIETCFNCGICDVCIPPITTPMTEETNLPETTSVSDTIPPQDTTTPDIFIEPPSTDYIIGRIISIDSETTIFDALEILKALVGMESKATNNPAALITEQSKLRGEPDIFDALEILKMLVGMENGVYLHEIPTQ